MAYEKKENTGALFANKDRKSSSHANAKGDALIDGVAYWVDAWTNEDKSGNKYQSLKFKRKEPRRDEIPRGAASTSYDHADDEDTIPF